MEGQTGYFMNQRTMTLRPTKRVGPFSGLVLVAVLVGGSCSAPAPVDPRTERALAAERVESWSDAAALWNEIYLASRASDVGAGVRSARALLESGQIDAARARLVDLVARAGERSDVHSLLGRTYERLGRSDLARASFERSFELEPDDAFVRHRLGDLLCGVGRFDEGLAHLRASLAIEPGNRDVRFDLGLRAAEAGLSGEAIAHLDASLEGAGDDERLRAARAAGPHELVIQWLSPVVARSPQATEALRRLGEAHMVAGDRARGLEVLTRAAESGPGDVQTIVALARAHIETGDLASARSLVDHLNAFDLDAIESELLNELQGEIDDRPAMSP